MGEWAKAFVSAQAEMPEITKDKEVIVQTRTGGSFKYRYADLPVIVEKIRPHLAKHGLAVAQNVETGDGHVKVETIVFHASGERETFGPIVLPAGNDAQAAGSAITYARRYALCAALNIAADDDDDGRQAKDSVRKSSAGAPVSPTGPTAGTVPPPNHSGGGADAASQQAKTGSFPAPSPEKSQPGGATQQGASGEVSAAPPADSLWMLIQDAVANGAVKRVKVHMVAARYCTENEEPIPDGYEGVSKCSAYVLYAVALELGLVEP